MVFLCIAGCYGHLLYVPSFVAMNPNRSQHSALTEIESRISVLERRLKNAKTARDSYVNYLRGKYPKWKPSLPTYDRRAPREGNLVGHLATAAYHWEGERTTITRPPPKSPQLYSQIPKSGPFMESDFTRTRERLHLMSQQLRILRDARLNMTTEEYFRTRAAREIDEYESSEKEIPSLDGVKKKLADMSFTLMEPLSTPTMEKIEELQRIEAREKMIQDIKSGNVPSLAKAPSEEKPLIRPDVTSFDVEKEAPATSAPTTNQPRIQFSTSAPTVTAPPISSTSVVTEQPKEKSRDPEPANAYSRIMGLLAKKSPEESDEEPQTKKVPEPALGSLSQYLQKSSNGAASRGKTTSGLSFGGIKSSKKSDSDSDDFFD